MIDLKYLELRPRPRPPAARASRLRCRPLTNPTQGHSIGADHRAGRGELTWAERARGNVGWRFAICYGAFSVLLVAAHAGQKAGLVEPPVEEATHQEALEESVADFEESVSKDSRVSVKKDDGEA